MHAHPSLWRGLASAVLATGVLAGCSPALSGPTGQPAPVTGNAPTANAPAGNTPAESTTAAGPTVATSPGASAGAAAAAPALPPSEPDAGGRNRAGGGNRGGGADGDSGPDRSAPALPDDWPAEVPLPPGQLQGSTGTSPQWSAMLLVPGGADTALAGAVRFYAANGFTSEGIAQLRRGNYRIVMVAMNRDHSAAETNLTIALIRG